MWKKGSEPMSTRFPQIVQRADKSLLFGMEWFPILGDAVHRQVRAMARSRAATHWVVASGAATSVGLVRHPTRKKARLHSAAATFAGLHPRGTLAAVVPLPHNRMWVVAVHEGAVLARTDQLHEAESSVQDSIRILREAHPGLTVLDERTHASGLLEVLFRDAGEQAVLQRNRRATRKLILILGSLAYGGIVAWDSGGVKEEPPAVDPVQAWSQAIHLAAQTHRVHGVAGLKALLDALYEAPVRIAGWNLGKVECRPQHAEWRCQALFRRDASGDNQSLMDAALPGWTLSFDPLEAAVASWSIPLPARGLAELRLYTARQNESQLVSALQSMVPAFMELKLDAPQSIPVAAPMDEQSRPIARPPGLPVPQRRQIRVQAPLRSMSLILPETRHMSWDRVELEVTQLAQPSLRHSGLQISLFGVLYEMDETHHASGRPGLAATQHGHGG